MNYNTRTGGEDTVNMDLESNGAAMGSRLKQSESSSSFEEPAIFGSDVNIAGPVGRGPADIDENPGSVSAWLLSHLKLMGSGAVYGSGMFSESYFLFAIGNIKPIWEIQYPECFNPLGNSGCDTELVKSFTYIEILGVICGMLSFGFMADQVGRRLGLCGTATIMFIGGVLTSVAYAGHNDYTGLFIFFAVSLFFFSYGVGGEYPLASASAAERAHKQKQKGKTLELVRGKTVVFTFAMQGVGNFVNTLVIMLILIGQGCTGDDKNCSIGSLDLTWRLQYGIGAIFLFFTVVGRYLYLGESELWLKNKEDRLSVSKSTKDVKTKNPAGLVLRHYWHRLVGTGIGWLVWDVVFYGTKLFQSTIIQDVLGGDTRIIKVLEYTLINSAVALVGYYAAGMVIDFPWMGRVRLQLIGFFFTAVLFAFCAVFFDSWSSQGRSTYLELLYYLSTFFGQFGPNCTTWLLPSEVFPTDARTFSHGTSATLGKLGALIATILFTFGNGGEIFSADMIFAVCAVCGAIGFFITLVFVPDVTTMNLHELDERFRYTLDPSLGGDSQYHGEAKNRKNLSLYERWMGHGCQCRICAGPGVVERIQTED